MHATTTPRQAVGCFLNPGNNCIFVPSRVPGPRAPRAAPAHSLSHSTPQILTTVRLYSLRWGARFRAFCFLETAPFRFFFLLLLFLAAAGGL